MLERETVNKKTRVKTDEEEIQQKLANRIRSGGVEGDLVEGSRRNGIPLTIEEKSLCTVGEEMHEKCPFRISSFLESLVEVRTSHR